MAAKKKEEQGDTSKNQVEQFMKKFKDDHLNYQETVKWKASTGSLLFDAELGGGFGAGGIKVNGSSFAGKAQPIDEPVLTINGWVPIGELKVGDKIIDSQGGEQEVIGTYPQGKKEVFKVGFSGGSFTRCCEEHLWETETINEKRLGQKSIKSLGHIKRSLRYGSRHNHYVSLVKPIEFPEKNLLIDPYLLGVLIGDGGITQSASISNIDEEVWSNIRTSLANQYPNENWSIEARTETTRNIVFKDQISNPLMIQLKSLGLFGKKSYEKTLPDEYKFGSIKQRIALLQGLVDTDGYIAKNKTEIVYYSTSEKLVDSVVDIVRSLGGLASKRQKRTHYLDENRKRVNCRDCYSACFYLPENIKPSRLTRKLERLKQRNNHFSNKIDTVVPDGEAECVCIKVSSLDSLYVTKDYILTHNTNCVLTCISNALKTVPNSKGLWFKAEGRLDEEVMDRTDATFVFSPEDWEVGTILVLETNIYEFVIDLINDLVKNNPSKFRYLFAIDSADALIRRDDEKKMAAEGERVGAGGMLMSLMFKKAGLILNKLGHCLFVLSQLRAKVETDKYAPKDQNKSVGGGGSNALTHGVNQVWNFKGRTKSKNIEEKDKIVGHYCEIELSKGIKERIDVVVKYPVRHGQTKGNSVWKEYEIADLLVEWEYVEKKGTWLNFDEEFIKELRDNGIVVEDDMKVQGLAQLKDWLDQNSEATKYLYGKFLKLFCEKS